MSVYIAKSKSIRKAIKSYREELVLNLLSDVYIKDPILDDGIVFDDPYDLEQKARGFKDYCKKRGENLTDDVSLLLTMLGAICKHDEADEDEDDNPVPFTLLLFVALLGSVFHKESELDNNAYLKNIVLKPATAGKLMLSKQKICKYELFICDMDTMKKGSAFDLPRIGVFDHGFSYPCLIDPAGKSFSVSPFEILTLQEYIDKSHGNVLLIGCGLGYLAYMISEKADINSITIVENSNDVLSLFEGNILPQFSNKDKIKIIKEDAESFLNSLTDGEYDYCIADIWRSENEIDQYVELRRLCKKFKTMETVFPLEKSFLPLVLGIFADVVLDENPEKAAEDLEIDYEDSPSLILKIIKEYIQGNDIVIETKEQLEKFLSGESLLKIIVDNI